MLSDFYYIHTRYTVSGTQKWGLPAKPQLFLLTPISPPGVAVVVKHGGLCVGHERKPSE